MTKLEMKRKARKTNKRGQEFKKKRTPAKQTILKMKINQG